jgi:hypothetical protein
MKPGPLFFLLAAAIVALLSAWWLLGGGSTSSAAGGLATNETQAVTIALEPDATLGDVEATEVAGSGLAEVEADGMGERTLGAAAKGPSGAVQAPRLEAATGPYTGRLVDPLGRPIKGTEVIVESWEDAALASTPGMQFNVGRKRKRPTATTGDDGKFTVEAKDSLGRSLGVSVVMRGYSDAPIKCVLDPEKGREMGDVALKPAVIVGGWVRDAEGSPVQNVRVRRIERVDGNGDVVDDLMDQMGFGGLVEAVRTDADGRFELPHEEEGLITLKLDGDDILPERWDGPTKRAGDVEDDLVITVKRAGQIEGMVVGYPVGRKRGMVAAAPLDALVEEEDSSALSALMAAQLSPAGDHTAKIGPDGSFRLSGLVPGARYRVRAIAKEMFVQTVELSEPVDTSAGGGPVTLQFDPGVTVTFQALDAKTKKPVEDMLISGKYGSTTAYLRMSEDAGDPPDRFLDGKVTLYELRPKPDSATLRLKIDGDGYFRNQDVELDVPESGTVNLGKVLMEPAPLLRFRVVDAVTGKPVKRARVTVDPMQRTNAGTGGSGEESLQGMGSTDDEEEDRAAAAEVLFGEYRVRSRGRTDRKGYCPLSMVTGSGASVKVEARGYATYMEAPFEPPVDEEEEIVIKLYGGGSLQVWVTDTAKAPVDLVRVECRREAGVRSVKKGTKTDENGFAEIEHIASGDWEVRAFRPSTSPFADGGMGSPRHPAEWVQVHVPRSSSAKVDLEVPALGDLSGTVFLGGAPAPDVRLNLASPDHVDRMERMLEFQDRYSTSGSNGTSGFDGTFTLTDIVPGDYIVLARHADLAMVVRTEVTVEVGDNSATIELPSTALEGRVLDDEGAPVVGAAISIGRARKSEEGAAEESMAREFLASNAGATARTDLDGAYRLVGVDADVQLVVYVQAGGYADSKSDPVQAAADETRTVNSVVLERAGALVVFRGDESGEAAVGFVRATPTGGRALEKGATPKIAILKAGRARLTGLVSGTWEVIVGDPSRQAAAESAEPRTVEIEAGETVELEF